MLYILERYNEFKTQIHDLFPTIYDTKFLSFQLKNKFEQGNHFYYLLWDCTFFSNPIILPLIIIIILLFLFISIIIMIIILLLLFNS